MIIQVLFLLPALFLSVTVSFASGSKSGDSMADSGYSKGKNIVYKQMLCDACPLKSVHLDKAVAKDIVMKLSQGDSSLGSFQRREVDSVLAYLNDRFSL